MMPLSMVNEGEPQVIKKVGGKDCLLYTSKRTLRILEEVSFSTSLQVPVENPVPMMPMQSMWQESAEFLTTIRFASRQLSLVRLM